MNKPTKFLKSRAHTTILGKQSLKTRNFIRTPHLLCLGGGSTVTPVTAILIGLCLLGAAVGLLRSGAPTEELTLLMDC